MRNAGRRRSIGLKCRARGLAEDLLGGVYYGCVLPGVVCARLRSPNQQHLLEVPQKRAHTLSRGGRNTLQRGTSRIYPESCTGLRGTVFLCAVCKFFPSEDMYERQQSCRIREIHAFSESGAFFNLHTSLAAPNTATLGHVYKLFLRYIV